MRAVADIVEQTKVALEERVERIDELKRELEDLVFERDQLDTALRSLGVYEPCDDPVRPGALDDAEEATEEVEVEEEIAVDQVAEETNTRKFIDDPVDVHLHAAETYIVDGEHLNARPEDESLSWIQVCRCGATHNSSPRHRGGRWKAA